MPISHGQGGLTVSSGPRRLPRTAWVVVFLVAAACVYFWDNRPGQQAALRAGGDVASAPVATSEGDSPIFAGRELRQSETARSEGKRPAERACSTARAAADRARHALQQAQSRLDAFLAGQLAAARKATNRPAPQPPPKPQPPAMADNPEWTALDHQLAGLRQRRTALTRGSNSAAPGGSGPRGPDRTAPAAACGDCAKDSDQAGQPGARTRRPTQAARRAAADCRRDSPAAGPGGTGAARAGRRASPPRPGGCRRGRAAGLGRLLPSIARAPGRIGAAARPSTLAPLEPLGAGRGPCRRADVYHGPGDDLGGGHDRGPLNHACRTSSGVARPRGWGASCHRPAGPFDRPARRAASAVLDVDYRGHAPPGRVPCRDPVVVGLGAWRLALVAGGPGSAFCNLHFTFCLPLPPTVVNRPATAHFTFCTLHFAICLPPSAFRLPPSSFILHPSTNPSSPAVPNSKYGPVYPQPGCVA